LAIFLLDRSSGFQSDRTRPPQTVTFLAQTFEHEKTETTEKTFLLTHALPFKKSDGLDWIFRVVRVVRGLIGFVFLAIRACGGRGGCGAEGEGGEGGGDGEEAGVFED
jgi:hypothetical protein